MKRILFLTLIFFSATTAFCAERFDAITWHGVRTYDVAALKQIEELQVGKIVAVRFDYRSKRLLHVKPSWYEASIWQRNPKEKSGFSYLRVFVARKDLPAFQSIPSDFQSTAKFTVYGQVQKDSDANYLFVRLIGRKVTLDRARNATVDW